MPALEVSEWVQGSPIEAFESGQTYVDVYSGDPLPENTPPHPNGTVVDLSSALKSPADAPASASA